MSSAPSSRGADISLDAIWKALDALELSDEISSFPMALQTIVDAHRLAAGQQQRLLIARALAQGLDLTTLDEATNAISEDM